MATIKMFGLDGQEKGAVELADEALVLDRGEQAVRDTIVARQAYYRAGTASTLSKGEVNGSNRKPWKQKATARGASAYQMMLHAKVLVARPAWEDLAARLADAGKKETVA